MYHLFMFYYKLEYYCKLPDIFFSEKKVLLYNALVVLEMNCKQVL